MKKLLALIAIGAALMWAGCYYDSTEELYPGNGLFVPCDTTHNVSYQHHIVPIMQNYCYSCHAGSNPSSQVPLDSYTTLAAYAANGTLEGNVFHQSTYNPMPPSFLLDSCYLNQIHNWIANGYPNN